MTSALIQQLFNIEALRIHFTAVSFLYLQRTPSCCTEEGIKILKRQGPLMINDRHLKFKKNHQVENVFPQSNFISSTFTPLQALLVGGKM